MNLSEAIDHIRPSVVQIYFWPKNTGKSLPLGTGFIIDEAGHIVTAAHVVEDAKSAVSSGHEVIIGLAYPNLDNEEVGGFHNITVQNCFLELGYKVLKVDSVNDVALLQMDPNPFETPPDSMIQIGDTPLKPLYAKCSISTDRQRGGEEMAVSGYPLEFPTLITTGGNLASGWHSEDLVITDGSHPVPVERNMYFADISVNPGNSGGPAYRLSDGCVFGVCIAFRNAPVFFMDSKKGQVRVENRPIGVNSGLAIVASISHALDLLKLENDTNRKDAS